LEIGEPQGSDWLRVGRTLEPGSPELTELLTRDDEASNHRSAHANALSTLSFHAGHGIAAVAVRSAHFSPGGLNTLYDVVLRKHLQPLSEELHRRTRAGLRQLYGGRGQAVR
jgi:hypothetical protein